MYRSKLNKTNRLSFESSLLAESRRPRVIRPRIGRLILSTACLVSIVALAAWGMSSLRWPVRAAKGDTVARAAGEILSALRSGSFEQAREVCAESETGQKILIADDQQHAKPNMASTDGKAASSGRESLPATVFLASVRASLADRGVVWGEIRPLALGGMQADVQDVRRMKDGATLVIGEIYFAAQDQVYALEFSARCCGDTAIITDFWRCAPIAMSEGASLAELKDRAAARIRTFMEEPIDPGVRVGIKSPRLVFVPLQSA